MTPMPVERSSEIRSAREPHAQFVVRSAEGPSVLSSSENPEAARRAARRALGRITERDLIDPFPVADRHPQTNRRRRRRSARQKPRLLDLFCGAGGATRGYQDAGFEVWGVDIEPQPRYVGDVFHHGDAVRILESFFHPYPVWKISDFDAIHASPPCQAFTAYRRKGHGVGDGYPNLIAKVREELACVGLPYVIENVPGAPLENPITLCGSSFGLDIRRHRLFESNYPITERSCDHGWQTPRFPPATNRKNLRSTVEVGVWRIPLDVQQRAMGIDWMTREELSQAIPPAYTEYVGWHLMRAVSVKRMREAA